MTVKLKLKIMKKSIFTLLGIVLATVSVMAASFTLTDDDRAIKYEQLRRAPSSRSTSPMSNPPTPQRIES